MLVAQGGPARAEDGCQVLEELVRDSVRASATEYGGAGHARGARLRGRAGAVGSTFTGRQVCANTSEVTTRAFGEALAALNMRVTWNRGPMDPGDYCLSGDLSRCYPSHSPSLPAMSSNQLAFVYDAWKGVRSAVASQMPFGTAAGLSQFTPGSLDAALDSSLGVAMDRPPLPSNDRMSRR